MPQINRVRVNNVKYNFGTQFYDDFIMRLNGGNTIYDLANGGGKSLLMLLLLQNVIPNCTLDEKQPVEKLFRDGCGNTVIHSLVEWKLDACYRQEHYKYMTTGFCARRGRNGGGQEEGTEAPAFKMQEEPEPARDPAGIEYFNYCIFYREFGDNDIKNLPLASNGERITYSGLKAYLRELEKNDFNVRVKIFERKGDYQNFIAGYGLYESQWEIVRGINKTEGHVRAYFETNYRTSRKVVEDLLIEEIIQKSFHNRLGVENDEGQMARTLLDIKDKLVELSKKHAQISSYDSQMTAIADFAGYVETFQQIYERKEQLEQKLFELLLSSRFMTRRQAMSVEQLETLQAKMQQEMASEQCRIQTAEVISEQRSKASVEALVQSGERALQAATEEHNGLQDRLTMLESVNDYMDYEQYARALDALEQTVQNRLRGHTDIVKELKIIAAIYYERIRIQRAAYQDRCSLSEKETLKCGVQFAEAQKRLKEAEQRLAVADSRAAFMAQDIENEEKQLAQLMENTGLLVAENAEAACSACKEALAEKETRLAELSRQQEQLQQQRAKCQANLSGIKVRIPILKEQLSKAQEQRQLQNEDVERLSRLQEIYHAAELTELSGAIFKIYRKMDREYTKTQAEAEKLRIFMEHVQKGTYVCSDPLRDKLKAYLTSHYGDDVVDGHEWFSGLNAGQKRDVFKRAPFVEYSFVVKEDFERIREDAALRNFERGAYAIPLISEQILYDTKLEVNKELVAFAMKDMAFLREDARREAELTAAAEELDALRLLLAKQEDRRSVVWSDYLFVIRQETIQSQRPVFDARALQEELNQCAGSLTEQKERNARLTESALKLQKELETLKEEAEQDKRRIDQLCLTGQRSQSLNEKYTALSECRAGGQAAALSVTAAREALTEASLEQETAKAAQAAAQEALAKLDTEWERTYQPYYNFDGEPADINDGSREYQAFLQMTPEKLESRFYGLEAVLKQHTSDVSDKEELMNHYRVSMQKCRQAIEYRGSSFDEIQKVCRAGGVSASPPVVLQEMKDRILKINRETSGQRAELDAQNALLNRLEGSIAHGIHQIEEKYGAYEPFECEQPESFIKQHRVLIKKLSDNMQAVQQKLKHAEKDLKDLYVIEKDLERIAANAGIRVPEREASAALYEDKVPADGVLAYEDVVQTYEKHLKLAAKSCDAFYKRKQLLTDLLDGFDAPELAQEVRSCVQAPETISQARELAARLKETNTFIQLEKDRIAKGIEDMERIKDNFENRCIQTCSNIRTELDRLPKLSNITMDHEAISMIGLQIPYVPETQYKDRMSAYIDETVMMAESFTGVQERLKYIRNRLTWKRLFSVIVTDMNAVRIQLYKRERLKDQSRYLRYEEAVGSTGQSQGIYIQFLIAVINYISSINAGAKENTVVGKTLFIDNPFGAAKDIYIWEPIFALLKANHVQLIVPARGATPAITGRFDVNYILGQKLCGKRQQTVVVDYYSKTVQTQLEYTRMDYEQAVFDFLED